jgi:hypothetical protein
MAEQSATEPEEALKEQGEATREQQRRIANGKAPLRGETLAQAAKRYPKPGPGGAGGMSTGHREIQRGANDESEHRKRRGDG